MEKQRTLVLIKPDALKRGLAGMIISRLERMGLKIVGAKMVLPSKELAKKHYPVTEEWYKKVGNNTLTDCRACGVNTKELMETEDPLEIGKKIHQWNVDFLTSGPVIAMVWEGYHAIEVARKLAGETVPILAQPGTIRGDYSSTSALSSNIKGKTIVNLIHTSKNKEEAEFEINLWFGKEKPFDYQRLDEDLF